MTTAKAERLLLSRLSSAATVLLSVHLALPEVPAWADGQDAEGCAVVLVGAHHLRSLPDGEEAVRLVLEALGRGEWPEWRRSAEGVAGSIMTHRAAEPDATRAKQAHFAVMFSSCSARCAMSVSGTI